MEILQKQAITVYAVRVQTAYGVMLVQYDHDPTDDEILNHVRDAIRDKVKKDNDENN